VTAPSKPTRVSSEAENSSLKILKCLCAELRASAAKDASRRITGRAKSSCPRADSSSVDATNNFFRKSLRDLLRTGKGRDGSGLCVVIVGKVLDLDLESGSFGARSDG
jgi:hypothetical protein